MESIVFTWETTTRRQAMNTNQREQKNAAFSQQVNDWFHFPGCSEANVSLYQCIFRSFHSHVWLTVELKSYPRYRKKVNV